MLGRYRHGRPEAEREGVQTAGIRRPALALVGDKYQRRRAFAQEDGELLVERRDARTRVDQQQGHIRLGSGAFGPGRACARAARGRRRGLETGGIPHPKAQGSEARHALRRRSRVTPGSASTMAARRPTRRLNRVDFPTLGRPTIATVTTTKSPRGRRSRAWSRRCARAHLPTTARRSRRGGEHPKRTLPRGGDGGSWRSCINRETVAFIEKPPVFSPSRQRTSAPPAAVRSPCDRLLRHLQPAPAAT